MTIRRWLALTAMTFVVSWPAVAGAHRLDEYLQVTRIAIGTGSIAVDVALTPGVDVADSILAAIDTDHDTRISAGEADAYAHRVAGDLRLVLDDAGVPLTLVRQQFPDETALRLGEGVIRLSLTGVVAPISGPHRISYSNTHMPTGSVYLANLLVPDAPQLRVTRQQRDELQRSLAVDFQVTRPSPAGAWSIVAAALMAGLLAGRRGLRPLRAARTGGRL